MKNKRMDTQIALITNNLLFDGAFCAIPDVNEIFIVCLIWLLMLFRLVLVSFFIVCFDFQKRRDY
jgi:hypothetical protein